MRLFASSGYLRCLNGPQLPYLWHRDGDAINAVLAAAGYNLRRLAKWLSFFLFEILARLNLELEVSAALRF